MSESLHKHAKWAHTQTVKKLLKFPQVSVHYCFDGKTPIMAVESILSGDEKCAEMLDVLIQAGALNSKSQELWYILLYLGCLFVKSAIAATFINLLDTLSLF